MKQTNTHPQGTNSEYVIAGLFCILGVSGNILAAWVQQVTLLVVFSVVLFLVGFLLWLRVRQERMLSKNSPSYALLGLTVGVMESLVATVAQSAVSAVTVLAIVCAIMLYLGLSPHLANMTASSVWLRQVSTPGVLRALLAGVLSVIFFETMMVLASKVIDSSNTLDRASVLYMDLMVCGKLLLGLFFGFLMGSVAAWIAGNAKGGYCAAAIGGIGLSLYYLLQAHDPISLGCNAVYCALAFLLFPLLGATAIIDVKKMK